MTEMFQKIADGRGVIHPAGQVVPFDTGTGAVGSVLPITAVVGVSEFAFDFYAIKHGAAEVWQRDQRIRVLGAGDFFGELGVTRPDAGRWSRRRSASVVVTAPTDAIAIDGAAVRRLTEQIPKLRDALRKAAAQARQFLIARAAERLELPLEELSIEDGLSCGHNRSISYGELIGEDIIRL